jgi:hypothetical protein
VTPEDLREHAAGMAVSSTNLPDLDWSAYTARLTAVAEAFPPS